MHRAIAAFRALFRSFRRDERGATMALTALTITALLAITGLAVDAGWWYALHRQNQSAADAAALSAAYEVMNNSTWTQSQLVPFASLAAQQNGYQGTTPDVTYPYSDSLVSNAVEVVLHQPQSTWFAAFANFNNVTISNRAVATVSPLDSPCMYVLSPTAPGALSITGSANIQSPTCSICVDSDSSSALSMKGGAQAVLYADTLLMRGQIGTTGSVTPHLTRPAQFGYQGCTDPFAAILTHANLTAGISASSACTVTTSNGATTVTGTNGQCYFAGGFTVNNTATGNTTLSPGIYWITDGDLTVKNATLSCSGCTIILTTTATTNAKIGDVDFSSNGFLNLTAPTSCTLPGTSVSCAGMVLLQDPDTSVTLDTCNVSGTLYNYCTNANSASTLNGLVYFPNGSMDFQGTPSSTGPQCLMVVALTVNLRGNPAMATSGCSALGLTPPTVYTVSLVE